MQTIRIDSEQIKLPMNVYNRFKGKQVRFIESANGFFIEPVIDKRIRSSSKLANLKRRVLINGDPDELVNVKVGEWNEEKNL